MGSDNRYFLVEPNSPYMLKNKLKIFTHLQLICRIAYTTLHKISYLKFMDRQCIEKLMCKITGKLSRNILDTVVPEDRDICGSGAQLVICMC
jgi:hypothetical protein